MWELPIRMSKHFCASFETWESHVKERSKVTPKNWSQKDPNCSKKHYVAGEISVHRAAEVKESG